MSNAQKTEGSIQALNRDSRLLIGRPGIVDAFLRLIKEVTGQWVMASYCLLFRRRCGVNLSESRSCVGSHGKRNKKSCLNELIHL